MNPYLWWGIAGWVFAMVCCWSALRAEGERRYWQGKAELEHERVAALQGDARTHGEGGVRHVFFWTATSTNATQPQPPDDCPCLGCGRTYGELRREAAGGQRQPVPAVYERAFAGKELRP